MDEHGNTVKIKNNASAELTSPEQIQKVSEEYYGALFSEDVRTKWRNTVVKETLNGNPVGQEAEDKVSQAVLDSMSPLVDTIDMTGLTVRDQSTLASAMMSLAAMSGKGDIQVKVPLSIITVENDTASFDSTEIETWVDGVKATPANQVPSEATQVHLLKKDGKWVMNGKKMAASIGLEIAP